MLSNPLKEGRPNVIRQKPLGVITRQSTDCYAVRNPLVAEALHWIQHHFQRGIQATDVAEAVGITQQGLQKLLKNLISVRQDKKLDINAPEQSLIS